MVELKICKGCNWNHYPECQGKIDEDGSFEKIDNLVKSYVCSGFRDTLETHSDVPIIIKTELELKVEELEEKVRALEDAKEAESIPG